MCVSVLLAGVCTCACTIPCEDAPLQMCINFCFCFVAVSGGMSGGGRGSGWGFAGVQQQPMAPRNPQQPNYEAMFNSLFPINGMVTGKYT